MLSYYILFFLLPIPWKEFGAATDCKFKDFKGTPVPKAMASPALALRFSLLGESLSGLPQHHYRKQRRVEVDSSIQATRTLSFLGSKI